MFTITSCKRLLTDAREVVVVQLQFLDLMIPKECSAVPMDAATRADLIDLMARLLVAVFHEEGGRVQILISAHSGNSIQTGIFSRLPAGSMTQTAPSPRFGLRRIWRVAP